MRHDPADLRQHYALLSNDALLEMNPDELTGDALVLYQSELHSRHLTRKSSTVDAEPEWMANAVAACSYIVRPGETPVADVGEMRQFVEAAGIPCMARLRRDEEDLNNPVEFCELMVPAGLHLHAISVLDQEIFNPEMEEEWNTHFGFMSDADLVAMNPKDLTAGLRDRAERLEKVYAEERRRRGI